MGHGEVVETMPVQTAIYTPFVGMNIVPNECVSYYYYRHLVLMMVDLYGLLYYLLSFFSLFIYNGLNNKKVMTSLMAMKREDKDKLIFKLSEINIF
jgi:hypothetical protein